MLFSRENKQIHKNTSPKKKLKSTKSIQIFIAICWIAYFSTYLGRLNYQASMNEIIRTGFLTKADAGMVGTGFFFCYGFGQLISGSLGDKISSKKLVFLGIMLSAVINMLMFLAINSKVMFILWCVNGLAQSLTWSPLIKILSDRLTQKKCKEACIFLTTTVATGTLATYLLSAFIIKISNWRSIFILSFLVLGFVSVVWFITIGKIEKEAEIEGYIETDEEMKQARNISTIEAKPIKLWRFIVTAGLLPILVCVIIQGILKDGVTAWVPTFISELFHLGSVTSILITTLLPIVNLAGVYATNYVNNHFLQSEVKTSGYCFAITTFALFCLILFGKYSILIAIPLLALITTGMIGVNTMFISLLPLNFIRTGKVSTITGILNFSVYMGSAVSSFGIGIISQQYGWGITMLIWFMLAFIGAVICFIIRNWR